MTKKNKEHDDNLLADSKSKRKKKESLISKILNPIRERKQKEEHKAPVTLNVGIASLLVLCYLSIIVVSVASAPIILVVILPTIYILIRYIQLERDAYKKKYG